MSIASIIRLFPNKTIATMTDRAKAHRKALVPRVAKKARVADTFKSFSFNINDQNADQGLNPEMVYTVDELVNTCPPLHRATASLCADVFGDSQQLSLEEKSAAALGTFAEIISDESPR